ncbi:hypothetical protein GVX81_09065 [[Haemophilus] felis]|uniref:Terminase small subunit n=1 Tax=[Haemophilus] felis TaxID=123822 RepID=A0A1T0AX14_9PAST|nr:hypothetical protein [[Haemophilus] felis]OOS01138.1 hypothetical protein B0188_10145 [[Haemophilus] felis]
MTLTQKQENFCLKYIELGNASEAYRQVYNAENMKPETVNRRAKELMDNSKITARINELQTEHAKRHNITVNDLLDELEIARKGALENGAYSVAVSATMGKAKILGFDKQQIELKNIDMLPTSINVNFGDELH